MNQRLMTLAACASLLATPAHAQTDAARADAAGRASLANAGAHGGHDGKFHVRSADNTYRLDIRFTSQFRYYVVLDADDASISDDEDVVNGFEFARNQISFEGHITDPRLKYRLRGAFARSGGAFVVDDAFGTYDLGGGWKVRWGQWKIAFDREYAQASGVGGLAVERSLTSTIFRVNRSQGLGVWRDGGQWRAFATINDGRRAANTAFFSSRVADIALTGRVELRFGEAGWKAYGDATSFRGAKTGVLVGAGVHWQQDGRDLRAPDATGATNFFGYTADATVEGDGWNLMAVWYGRVIDSPSPSQDDTLHDFAFNLQGGVFVCEHAELFARYEHIFPDTDRGAADDDFPGFVAGANWYFIPESHAVKLTGQLMYYPEAQADASSVVSAPNSNVGLVPDGDDGQFALAWQFQLLF